MSELWKHVDKQSVIEFEKDAEESVLQMLGLGKAVITFEDVILQSQNDSMKEIFQNEPKDGTIRPKSESWKVPQKSKAFVFFKEFIEERGY